MCVVCVCFFFFILLSLFTTVDRLDAWMRRRISPHHINYNFVVGFFFLSSSLRTNKPFTLISHHWTTHISLLLFIKVHYNLNTMFFFHSSIDIFSLIAFEDIFASIFSGNRCVVFMLWSQLELVCLFFSLTAEHLVLKPENMCLCETTSCANPFSISIKQISLIDFSAWEL